MAHQIYKTDASQEYVISGNDVIVKCQYPSFVSDFLSVTGWRDSEGTVYKSSPDHLSQSGNLPVDTGPSMFGCCMVPLFAF